MLKLNRKDFTETNNNFTLRKIVQYFEKFFYAYDEKLFEVGEKIIIKCYHLCAKLQNLEPDDFQHNSYLKPCVLENTLLLVCRQQMQQESLS